MKSKLVIFGITGIFLFIASTVFFYKMSVRDFPLPVLGEVRTFELTDEQGRSFSPKNLLNKVWVADFIFTTCGGICPVMSRHMASLHRSYVLEGDVAMVSITVNPDHDTPTILKQYAKKWAAKEGSWYFLTGSAEAIKNVAVNIFKLGNIDEPVFHSEKFILIDRNARIRGYYDGTDEKEIQRLFVDIARVRKEKH